MSTAIHPLTIGVIIWMNQEYGRRVLAGVLNYATTHGFQPVQLFDATAVYPDQDPLKAMDGLIVVLAHHEQARFDAVPGIKVLVPHLSASTPHLTVAVDAAEVGKLAAEHLLSLGLRHLAVVPYTEHIAFPGFLAGARQAAEAAGATLLPPPPNIQDTEAGAAWVAGLPPSCGILAQQDKSALFAIEWARAAGRRVPEDLAIMGVENDAIECMTHTPALTSVAVPAEQLGWLAAQALEQRLTTGKASSITVPPGNVVVRDSTRIVTTTDETVLAATRYMNASLAKRLDIAALAKREGISRRTLEQRFRKSLGRGVHQELTRLRLERALSLLRVTNTALKQTALSLGFTDQAKFTRFIRNHTGLTPSQFRRQHGVMGDR